MKLQDITKRLSERQGLGLLLTGILLLVAILAGTAFLATQPNHVPAVAGNSGSTPSPNVVAQPPAMVTATIAAAPANTTHQPIAGLATPGASGAPLPRTLNPQLPLLGRRIGLDPGHGPRDDLGAVLVDPNTSKLVLSEAEFNLDVALRCRDLLRARGAAVVLTRETATTFTAPWPVDANGDGIAGGEKDDLQERVDILNTFHAEAFISIHANSAVNLTDLGKVQVFYCATAGCASPTESRRLGELVLGQIQTKMAGAGYPVQVPQLHVDTWQDGLHFFELGPINPPGHVRATHMPGVLSETLYVTSPVEAAQLKRDSVRQAIALAYADALQAFLTASGR